MTSAKSLDAAKLKIPQRFVKGHGCFFNSLANLLIYSGDESVARRVLKQSSNYYLKAEENSIGMGLQTKAVRELTGGAYNAKSVMPTLDQKNLEQIRDLYGQRAKEILEIIEEEIRQGNIKHACSFDYFPPAILFTTGCFVYNKSKTCLEQRVSSSTHSIVHLGGDVFIDNGKILECDINKLTFMGALTVEMVRR